MNIHQDIWCNTQHKDRKASEQTVETKRNNTDIQNIASIHKIVKW